jgi:hypothetical protein
VAAQPNAAKATAHLLHQKLRIALAESRDYSAERKAELQPDLDLDSCQSQGEVRAAGLPWKP